MDAMCYIKAAVNIMGIKNYKFSFLKFDDVTHVISFKLTEEYVHNVQEKINHIAAIL